MPAGNGVASLIGRYFVKKVSSAGRKKTGNTLPTAFGSPLPLDRSVPSSIVIYFAYGSNMLERRLKHPDRVPAAVARGIAAASGFIVRFHKRSQDGSGKCTLVAADDAAEAWGVLFNIPKQDFEKLDHVEGVHTGGYARQPISVRLTDGQTEAAHTYIAQEAFIDDTLIPFDWYLGLVVAGAIEHGLPAEHIEALRQTRSRPDPEPSRAAEMKRLLEKT